jgi:hypothetical protein
MPISSGSNLEGGKDTKKVSEVNEEEFKANTKKK